MINPHTRYIAIAPLAWGTSFDDPQEAIRVCRKNIPWHLVRNSDSASGPLKLFAVGAESTIRVSDDTGELVITHAPNVKLTQVAHYRVTQNKLTKIN